MFICQQCKQTTGPRIPSTVKVLETRAVEYENHLRIKDEETGKVEKIVVRSKGTEIVREIRICPTCKGKEQVA